MSDLKGLTRITDYYFDEDFDLTGFEIPDTIVSISEDAFTNTDIYNNISNWDNDGVLYIDKWLIKVDESIEGKYVIKEGTVGIADYAFSNCENLTTIEFPNSVKYIGSYAFDNCNGLKYLYLGSGLVKIGYKAFYGCNDFDDVAYKGTVDNWSQIDFDYEGNPFLCEANWIMFKEGSLRDITIDKVSVIKKSAFEHCSSLISVTIGGSVEVIGNAAFATCYDLTSVDIEDSVKEIEDYAFQLCDHLESVNICNNVKKIGAGAFESCFELSEIVFDGTIDEWEKIEKGADWCYGVKAYSVQCLDGEVEISDF